MEKLQKDFLENYSNRGSDMEAIYEELRFVGVSFMWGIILLIAYDCFIIGRNCIPHKRWMIGLEDFLFWLLAGCSAFFVMYRMNHGIIRAFSIVAILIGMAAYHFSISRFLVKWITIGIQKIEKGIGAVIKFICTPFCFLEKEWYGPYNGWEKEEKRESGFV